MCVTWANSLIILWGQHITSVFKYKTGPGAVFSWNNCCFKVWDRDLNSKVLKLFFSPEEHRAICPVTEIEAKEGDDVTLPFYVVPLSTCLRSLWTGQEPTRVWSSTPIDTNRSHIMQRWMQQSDVKTWTEGIWHCGSPQYRCPTVDNTQASLWTSGSSVVFNLMVRTWVIVGVLSDVLDKFT